MAHQFRDVAPGLSACVSSVQVEKGHPSWQYPHGTKSHDAQLPGGPVIGALVGALFGAAGVMVGSLVGATMGEEGRQFGGMVP